MSAELADVIAVDYVKRYRADLWNRYHMACEQQRPLTHAERIGDYRASKDIYNHQFWPTEAVEAFGDDWRKPWLPFQWDERLPWHRRVMRWLRRLA